MQHIITYFFTLFIIATTDTYLFGADLTKKLNESRALDKISREIKIPPRYVFAEKQNLNFKGPGVRMPLAPTMGNQGFAVPPRHKVSFIKKKGPKPGAKNQEKRPPPRYQPYQRNK